MTKNTYKPSMPDLMEAIFDICYLTFDLIAGILFFALSKGNILFILYGTLTLTLCGGDAFHLIPRVIRAFKGSSDRIKKQLGLDYRFLPYHDRVLYPAAVYLEIQLLRNEGACCVGDGHLGHRHGIAAAVRCGLIDRGRDMRSERYFCSVRRDSAEAQCMMSRYSTMSSSSLIAVTPLLERLCVRAKCRYLSEKAM